MEPKGTELVERYKAVYSMPDEAPITEQMVLTHWDLERKLTEDLLASTPDTRWEVFDRGYTRLYRELDWLNQFAEESTTAVAANGTEHARWCAAIGEPPLAVYEIGSGRGELITYLAQQGFHCKATEITRERGAKHQGKSVANLSWAVSDGVHLDRFESTADYDVVLSDQVIEHLHPDDLHAHLVGVHRILKPGGRYTFNTPHRFSGPHDVSRVFKCDEPQGMHLKEYTHRECVAALRRAGFRRIRYAFVPARGATVRGLIGWLYLRVVAVTDVLLAAVPEQKKRRRCARFLRRARIFNDNIALTAEKPRAA